MTDDRDIVTQLREYDPDVSSVYVVREAADEIERLRAVAKEIAQAIEDNAARVQGTYSDGLWRAARIVREHGNHT